MHYLTGLNLLLLLHMCTAHTYGTGIHMRKITKDRIMIYNTADIYNAALPYLNSGIGDSTRFDNSPITDNCRRRYNSRWAYQGSNANSQPGQSLLKFPPNP